MGVWVLSVVLALSGCRLKGMMQTSLPSVAGVKEANSTETGSCVDSE